MPAYHTTLYGRVVSAEAPSPQGAARLMVRELYGNGMTVTADPLRPDTFFVTHPYPREWRPVAPLLRLESGAGPGV